MNEYLKWIMPSIKNRSIENSEFRFKKAKEQAEMSPVNPKEVIELVNNFLNKIELKTMDDLNFNPFIQLEDKKRPISYSKIFKETEIKYKNDIVWIKFTKGNFISVIGTGCDISFSKWAFENTTAGKISQYLIDSTPDNQKKCEYEWNNKFVLIFPLKDIPDYLSRSDIESGIRCV